MIYNKNNNYYNIHYHSTFPSVICKSANNVLLLLVVFQFVKANRNNVLSLYIMLLLLLLFLQNLIQCI